MYQANPGPAPAAPPVQPQNPRKPHGCLTAFLGVMLAFSLAAALCFVNLRLTIFSADFWKDWLSESDSYERIEEILLPNIFSSVTMPAETAESDYDNWAEVSGKSLDEKYSGAYENDEELSPESLEAIDNLIQDSVTAEWLEDQSEGALDSFFDWVYGRDEELRIVFDLEPLQGAFASGMIDILEIEYNKLPPCPEDFSDIDTEELENMQCRYPDVDFEEVRAEYAKQNPEELGFGNIPTEYVIDEQVFLSALNNDQTNQAVSGSSESSDMFANPPHLYEIFMVAMWISIILFAIFLVSFILVYRRNRAALAKALGMTLLIPMAIVFVVDIIIYLSATAMTRGLIPATTQTAGDNMGMSAENIAAQAEIVSDFALPLLAEFLQKMLFYQLIISGIIIVIAVILLILARSWKNRQQVSYYSNNQTPS